MTAAKRKTTQAHVSPPHTPHTSITFSLETVIRLLVVSLGVAATIWATTGGIRSDVRDILTQMRAETEKREMQEKLVDDRMGTMRESINDQRRRTELLSIELANVKEMILKLPQVRR